MPPYAASTERRQHALAVRDELVRLLDVDVIDARLAPGHVAVGVELPQLVAIGPMPLTGRVVPLVLEPHGDPIRSERPQVLAQPVVLLTFPFPREERGHLLPTNEVLTTVPPHGVDRVGAGDPLGVLRVPGILRSLHLLQRGLGGERGDGVPRLHQDVLP
jgi:hypothetical protein